MESFYEMSPAIMNVLHLEKQEMQKIENHNINTEKLAKINFTSLVHSDSN